MCIITALNDEFPFPDLVIASHVAPHREADFLIEKFCLFRSGNFTMWVAREHQNDIAKCIGEKAKAVTENSNAPCIVRKEVPISIDSAHELLSKCNVKKFTAMQFGQKADVDNKTVEWALKNVRLFMCVCVLCMLCMLCVCVLTDIRLLSSGHRWNSTKD